MSTKTAVLGRSAQRGLTLLVHQVKVGGQVRGRKPWGLPGCLPFVICTPPYTHTFVGEPVQQDGASSVQGGGGHLEDTAAPKYPASLWLLGDHSHTGQEGPKGVGTSHGAHDLGDTQGVRRGKGRGGLGRGVRLVGGAGPPKLNYILSWHTWCTHSISWSRTLAGMSVYWGICVV